MVRASRDTANFVFLARAKEARVRFYERPSMKPLAERFTVVLIIFFALLSISTAPLSADTLTLIGSYNVNYRYNAAGCYSGGDFSPTQGNPYFCPGPFPPGPIFLDVAMGDYEAVATNPTSVAIWNGDATGGIRYEPFGGGGTGTVDFTNTSGHIVLYYWDWYVDDNPDTTFSLIDLYRVQPTPVPEPSALILLLTTLLSVGFVTRKRIGRATRMNR